MEGKKYKLIRVIASDDGLVHYSTARGEFDPAQTYCGNIDRSGVEYEQTNKKANCHSCILTAKVFVNGVIL